VAPESKAVSVALIGDARSNAAINVIALAGLAMLVMAVFACVHQRERARRRAMTARDIASHSLEGRRGGLVSSPSMVRGTKSTPAYDGWRPPRSDAIPNTRAEALEVLGMGVSPQATAAAIKKIVDGLRLSWHPDHASGPADRQVRELRLKQINAAWEIIIGKRAEI
jgi:hypothetical protein